MKKSQGEIIIDAVVRAAAIKRVIVGIDGTTTFVWESNSPEQIEAAIREAGYELTKIDAAHRMMGRGSKREVIQPKKGESCRTCGGPEQIVESKHPGGDNRLVCPWCLLNRFERILEVDHEMREALKGARKWLVRIHERRDDLPKSFLDNCDPKALADSIRELLSTPAPEVKP